MELIYLKESKIQNQLVACIGQFDGLHKGHIALLEETLKIGKTKNLKTAVITFDPHPDYVLGKIKEETYITPFEIKKELINQYGFDYLIVIKFTKEIANLNPSDFVNEYLVNENIVHTVVGFDFVFGRLGLGKAKDIESYSNGIIKNTIIDEVKFGGEKIASMEVKNSLVNGEVSKVNELLGRYYEIQGKVVYGNQVGSKIDVPTANILYDEEYVCLKPGVYATIFEVEGKAYPSITNIGHNPSFNYSKKLSLECHVIDFNNNVYDKNVKIKFVERIRDEIKFESIEKFKDQIKKDKEFALKLIN